MPFLKPDRRPQIRHPQGHPIDVIATFKKTGELKPLYFRVEDDRQERFIFMLSKAYERRNFNFVMTFECSYEAFGQQNFIVLLFDVTTNNWRIG
ncbi:MAG: hypothetical protein K0R46_3480 [Herbinix sp.]|nr:hypothetical protein [Herbinix sp.]